MGIKNLLLLFSFTIQFIVHAQSIHGTIKNKQTGENIAGVVVSIDEKPIISTNNYGFYSIQIKKIPCILSFSLLGYAPIKIEINKNTQTLQNIFLIPQTTQLDEVIINTKKNSIKNLQSSTNIIKQEQIKSIPSFTGTPDVLKSLQLLPGVQTANEGTTNLNIRGGSYDQNLIILDEAPIYNTAHALGFFSTFNADIIKSATIYKGNFPVQYGGRLSAVIDIITKDGNNQKISGSAAAGIAGIYQAVIEGPIQKNKSSFIISYRKSLVSEIIKLLPIFNFISTDAQILNNSNGQYINFYDFNFKLNFNINKNNKLFFSTYSGNDDYNFSILGNRNFTEWGNITNSIRWNHIFNNTLFSNATFYTSQYNNINKNEERIKKYRWKTDILDIGFKYDITHFLNNNNTLKYGIAISKKQFNPGVVEVVDSSNLINPFSSQILNNYEFNGYISNEQTINEKISVQYGIRYTLFADVGPNTKYTIKDNFGKWIDTNIYTPAGEIRDIFHSIEPRISFRYLLNELSSIKGNISYNQQNLHLLSNSSIGLPYDVWIPASKEIKPQTSIQYTLGYYTEIFKKKFVFNIEAYYKNMNNIIDFVDNANLTLNKNIEKEILPGIGRSYGVELFLEKQAGKLNGWVSYTFANTKYKIDGINDGNWFSPRYDIRHNLSVVGFYKISKRVEFSSTFKFTSGGFISFPTRSFRFDNAIFTLYEGRNGFELPSYHRLDIGIKLKSKKYDIQRLKKEWVFTIYNIYNQNNIFALFIKPDIGDLNDIDLGGQTNSNKAYFTYLFGIVPTISLNIKF